MRGHQSKLVHLSLALLFVAIANVNLQAQSPQSAKPAAGYHLLKRIEVGGEGGWDYLTVDSAARRLYVLHATRVVVIDLDKGAVVGEIPNTNGVHGVAIVPELGRGFTSNGRDNNPTIFDWKTLKVIAQVKTGANPDAIIYDPASRRWRLPTARAPASWPARSSSSSSACDGAHPMKRCARYMLVL